MKKKFLTILGIILFVYFLTQIDYEKLLKILNFRNIFFFILATLFVSINNIILYFRFKLIVGILLKAKFLTEFLYYRFLSILTFKDIGEMISKFHLINTKRKLKKSKGIFFVLYEKIYDTAISLIIIPLIFIDIYSLNFLLFFFYIFFFFSRKIVIKQLLNFINTYLNFNLKKKEITYLLSKDLKFLILTFLKIFFILAKFSSILIICDVDFNTQKLFINFVYFQFVNLISFTPGGLGVFDILASKGAQFIYGQTEMAVIFVLLNRIANVFGTYLIFSLSKFLNKD